MVPPSRLTPLLLATSALLAWGLTPGESASGMPGKVRDALRNNLPNAFDYERVERGYYQQLLEAGRPAALLSAPDPNHPEVTIDHGRLTQPVDDVREYILKPGLSRDPSRRIPWSTNAWGMRDREYAASKPSGTVRIALVGDSIATGWRVDDDEGFEPRLEAALNARSQASGGPAVEILNFAVPGHGPGQRWTHFSEGGWSFDPDLVLFESTPADPGWDERRLRNLLARGLGRDAPVYREVLDAARVPHKPGLDTEVYKGWLKPLRWELLAGVYRAVVADCRSRGVPAIWVLIPRVGTPVEPAERKKLIDLARASGFSVVLDVTDAYDGLDPSELEVSPNDFHPNAIGHERIARRLEAALAESGRVGLMRDRTSWASSGETPGEGVEPR
jgi:hypothetical protein